MKISDKFKKAHEFTKQYEGGYVDHPDDKGGATNYGISIQFLKDVDTHVLKRVGIDTPITKETIKQLAEVQAMELMYIEFWLKLKLEQHVDSIAFAIYDIAVNHGVYGGTRIVQRAINKYNGEDVLRVDGIKGEITDKAINVAGETLFPALIQERLRYYTDIVESNPKQRVFLKGWQNRTLAMAEYNEDMYNA